MVTTSNLGCARIGANRELKKVLEKYWSGKSPADELLAVGKTIRHENWQMQQEAGIHTLPVGDFSLYDHVLDTAFLLDVIPQRFRDMQFTSDLDLYFAMARGRAGAHGAQALEMTKWFDTNYHYLVPEFQASETFQLRGAKLIDHYKEATTLGYRSRPVILGPASFLHLGKSRVPGLQPFDLVEPAIHGYERLLQALAASGATSVQIDEPLLALDLTEEQRQAIGYAFQRFSTAVPQMKILVATYFGALGANLDLALHLPISALHLDLVRAPEQLDDALRHAPSSLTLSLGLVDGRNIWRTDLNRALAMAERAVDRLSSDRVSIAPSCSLLHVPCDLNLETSLAPEIKSWLAFGRQKLHEVAIIAKALNTGRNSVRAELDDNARMLTARRTSPRVVHSDTQERLAAVGTRDLTRRTDHGHRSRQQQALLHLPALPTTTIGSFPQTEELRRQRLRMKKHEISTAEYDGFIRKEIENTIRQQEAIGLDVLVHGEAERNDMVEYFGELLGGFAFTENGWVQSYGSRCVKPPLIYGDVFRKAPMTVAWWQFAQSLTPRPVKGMLTGPVTILQWSFVRDDQPRRDTCLQIALAIRDETLDLERAGCRIIQIDEPALREGLPLRVADAPAYLSWAVDCFKLASAGAGDATQIHTHMCYADFNDIVDAIAAMDADVISLESARSQMELLDAFAQHHYPNDIGPGVYDIHSPRVPDEAEMMALLAKALQAIPVEHLWVNPDCGLKTRRWEEATPALLNMVAAARRMRERISQTSSNAASPPIR